MKKFIVFVNCWVLILIALSGCNHKFFNSKKNHYHTVKSGDTLYSIAKKHHVKLHQLIIANNIKIPHTLYKGQRLYLPKKTSSYTPKKYSNPTKTIAVAHNNIEPKIVKYTNHNDWTWPANGPIIKQFINNGPNKINGIEISGKKGDPIMSAANGKVVYSGNNLRGYGNLIIIKHSEDFISAYAHNEKILVTEKQSVTKGQQIATMGNSESTKVALHFEVRYKGKPIDPTKLLVKR